MNIYRAAQKPEEDAYSFSKMMLNYMKNSQQQQGGYQHNNDVIKAVNGSYHDNQKFMVGDSFAFNNQKVNEEFPKSRLVVNKK